MFQQAAPLSASSALSVTLDGRAPETISPKQSAMVTPGYQRSDSFRSQNDNVNVNPEELFAKCTISEVKGFQHKLRAEADQKQQELRLMVGERYRDILQASTSIISMSKSSEKVLDALSESKAAILRQQDPPVLKGLPSQRDTDVHLHALQQLAAHVKLLIDAPENLWRLIERKKYFPATWLFLLVRVVHRALLRDNEPEGAWQHRGIDVPSEFPLIQRQWDVVSQHRPQIIHKATLSLRVFDIPSEDACAALVSLCLLDSRPLTDAFSDFLNQRTRALVGALSHHSNSISFAISSQTSPVQDVKDAMQTVLLIVVHTVKLARDIFDNEAPARSMMYNVLKFMQPDSDESAGSAVLPSELCLSTLSVLATLPSPIQLQLLPPNLKTYKPYVDLGSSFSMISQVDLSTKLDKWLTESINKMKSSFQPWLERLQSVKDVWCIKTSGSQTKPKEALLILNALDDHFRQRILELWKIGLQNAHEMFSMELNIDSPMGYLYHIPSIPQHSQLGLGSKHNPFEKHYSALRKRLLHRTRLLDNVMGTLETCARSIQDDISSMSSGAEDSRDLVDNLVEEYRPLAKNLCQAVVRTLKESEESLQENAGRGFAFLYMVLAELTSSSCFITLIGCAPDVAREFRQSLESLYDKTLDRWREYIASTSLAHDVKSLPSSLMKLKGLSTDLLRSLIALSTSTLQLGLPRDLAKRNQVVHATLKSFPESKEQVAFDLAILQQIVKRHGEDWHDVHQELAKRLKEVLLGSEKAADEALARCQNLLSPLLSYNILDRPPDDKQSFLLPFGMPVSDTQYQPAISVVKPGSRFGLLLVDGSIEF
ncbi:Vps51/Vps67 domain-containing protein [Amanita rubescens]|nr:Vps51/Vps67 domain-containing protein [Amanita rubescens]